MAHPYTTRARLQSLVSARDITALADRDLDSVEDAGKVDRAIASACNIIDGRLGFAYSVPFATVDATPSTPGLISDIADLIAVATLLFGIDDVWRKALLEEADAMLVAIAAKETFIDVTPVAATTRYGVGYRASTPFVSGSVCGVRRTRGI